MNIVVWTTGDKSHGMGHVARMSVLAKSLISHDHAVTFLTRRNTPGEKYLTDRFSTVIPHPSDFPQPKMWRKLLPDIAILDVEHGPSRATLMDCKEYATRTVVIGGVGFYISDQDSIDELVDLQIHQTGHVTHEAKHKSRSNYLNGTEYLILDESFVNARAARELRHSPVLNQHILVSMGGADPHDLTHHVAKALADAFPAQRVIAIYGPASQHAERKGFPNNVSIIESPPPEQFAQLMSEASVLITALGMTVYEALCVGVPVACTAWSTDHEATAQYLESKNAIAYLGQWNEFDSGSMFAFVHNVIALETYRDMRTKTGLRLVDGKGTERVVEKLEELGG